MDFKETLFKRPLVRRHIDDRDEEKSRMAEELTVTKEQNGYACWYQGREIVQPRIIGWVKYEKDDLIAWAVRIGLDVARMLADEGTVIYEIPKLHDLALDPVTERS